MGEGFGVLFIIAAVAAVLDITIGESSVLITAFQTVGSAASNIITNLVGS